MREIEENISSWVYFVAKAMSCTIQEVERMPIRYFIKSVQGMKIEHKLNEEAMEKSKKR